MLFNGIYSNDTKLVKVDIILKIKLHWIAFLLKIYTYLFAFFLIYKTIFLFSALITLNYVRLINILQKKAINLSVHRYLDNFMKGCVYHFKQVI